MDEGQTKNISSERRRALAKLGLAAGSVYFAPTLMPIVRNVAYASPQGNNGSGNGCDDDTNTIGGSGGETC